ncbi:hypothetical protein EV648_12426 [Kribbella sp. VKM Ac-2568]|nr:hypothetical protein EV648_12426 [Kribbella sp. VKM Ac-2568]
MSAIVLVLSVGLAVGVFVLAMVGRGDDSSPDVEVESQIWRRTTGEVISVLRTHSRMFVLVRYTVGTSLIQNHLAYPLGGAMPRAGQRMSIKYDEVSPARVVFDPSAHLPMPPQLPDPAISPARSADSGSSS